MIGFAGAVHLNDTALFPHASYMKDDLTQISLVSGCSWRYSTGTPHTHLPVIREGLCLKYGVWRSVYFNKKIVERAA